MFLCHDVKQLLEFCKKILNCIFLTYLSSQQYNKKLFPKFLHFAVCGLSRNCALFVNQHGGYEDF